MTRHTEFKAEMGSKPTSPLSRYLPILAVMVLAVIAFALLHQTPQQPVKSSLTVFVTNYGKEGTTGTIVRRSGAAK